VRRQLAAQLPTRVSEIGADGAPVATLTRPPALITDSIATIAFLKRLLNVSSSVDTSISKGIDCRRSTHRCTEVVVTTGCNGQHCIIGREIRHYRYTGHKPPAKPPAGSPADSSLLTAPIRARLSGRIKSPKKLTLVLSGAPHRRAGAIVAVNCFSSQGESDSSGTPLLKVAVPSRTQLKIPHHAHPLKACSVTALVTSTERGAIHARVVRG
jgi:hypothetical protein